MKVDFLDLKRYFLYFPFLLLIFGSLNLCLVSSNFYQLIFQCWKHHLFMEIKLKMRIIFLNITLTTYFYPNLIHSNFVKYMILINHLYFEYSNWHHIHIVL